MEINHGPSPYGRYKPTHIEPDQITKIPGLSDLEDLPEYATNTNHRIPFEIAEIHGSCSNGSINSEFNGKSGEFHIPLICGICEYINEIQVKWNNKRKEWIGITHNFWLESGAEYDESWSKEAYRLDDYCKKKIIQAFNIPKDAIPFCIANMMSPSELEKIASEIQLKSGAKVL